MFAGALCLLGSACTPEAAAPTSVDGVVFRNTRYRISQEVRSEGGSNANVLRVRLEPETGHHFAEEAPVGLTLRGLPGVSFDAERQRSDDAVVHSEQLIEFESGFQVAEAGAPGGAVPAEVKFGLCSDGSERCEIIEREIELKFPATP